MSPTTSRGRTISACTVVRTAAQPRAGRVVTVARATCGARVSTTAGPTTLPALAGCSVASTRMWEPTTGAPTSRTTSFGTATMRTADVTPSACATQGAVPRTRTRSLPWTNCRPRNVTGRRGVTAAWSVTHCAYRAFGGPLSFSAIESTVAAGSGPASLVSVGRKTPAG